MQTDEKMEGLRDDSGKPRINLLPTGPLVDIAKVITFGAVKYGDYNWANGMLWSRCYNSLMRHMWAFWAGEDDDSVSGLSHLAHAGCNILFLMVYATWAKTFPHAFKKFDDRPPTMLPPVEPATSLTTWADGEFQALMAKLKPERAHVVPVYEDATSQPQNVVHVTEESVADMYEEVPASDPEAAQENEEEIPY